MDLAWIAPRTALSLHRTVIVVSPAGTINDRFGFGNAAALLLKLAPVAYQQLASRA